MRRRYVAILAALLSAATAAAADFKPYANGRFGYAADIPSDFKTTLMPENGDGLGLQSPDGKAKLSIWGNYVTEGGFSQESDLRKKFATDDGWKFTYEKRGASSSATSSRKRRVGRRRSRACRRSCSIRSTPLSRASGSAYLRGRGLSTARSDTACTTATSRTRSLQVYTEPPPSSRSTVSSFGKVRHPYS